MDNRELAGELVKMAREMSAGSLAEDLKEARESVKYNAQSMARMAESPESFGVGMAKHYLERIMRSVAEYEKVMMAISKAKGPYQDAIDAYSDANDLSNEPRSLDWRGAYTSAGKVAKMMKMAVPDGYNEFDADRVGAGIKRFGSLKWSFARESSPALYCKVVKGKAAVRELGEFFLRDMKADSAAVTYKGKLYRVDDPEKFDTLPENINVEMRFWWD